MTQINEREIYNNLVRNALFQFYLCSQNAFTSCLLVLKKSLFFQIPNLEFIWYNVSLKVNMFARLRLNSDLRNICQQHSVQHGRVDHNVYTRIIKISLHLYMLGKKSPALTIFQLALFLINFLLVF